jgi:flagellar biogenesis protein FliO
MLMDNLFSRLIHDERYRRYLPVFIIVLSGILFSLIIWAVYSAANLPAAAQPDNNLYSGDTTSIVVAVFFRLVLVIALIYLCFGAYRWLQNKKSLVQPRKRLSVIETVRLSPRQAIHIIRVDKTEYLVSATDQSLNLLSEIQETDDEYEERLNSDPSNSEVTQAGFDQVFQQSIKKSLNAIRGGQKIL